MQPLHPAQYLVHFSFGEYRWQVLGTLSAQSMKRGSQFNLQNISIQKLQGVQRLVLRGSRDIGLLGQVRKKGFNLRCAHFSWVPFVMEENIALCPMDVRFFGGIGVVLDTDRVAQLV
jgi:hypothetical protein